MGVLEEIVEQITLRYTSRPDMTLVALQEIQAQAGTVSASVSTAWGTMLSPSITLDEEALVK